MNASVTLQIIKIMSKLKLKPRFWVGLLLIIVLSLLPTHKCQAAQIDTVMCRYQCIEKFIEIPQQSGKSKIYALYHDADIQDLISVSKSVYEYIQLCKQNRIEPALGIRLRDGQITSIVKLKKKYYVKKK